MLSRYGLGLLGFVAGGLLVWGLFGFKNPFKKNGSLPKCSELGLDEAQTASAKADGKCA